MTDELRPPLRLADTAASVKVVQADGSETDLAEQAVLMQTGLYRLAVERPDSMAAAHRCLECVADYETQGAVRLFAITVSERYDGSLLLAEAAALFSWEPVEPPKRAL